MKNRRAFVLFAKNILNMKKWKATTLRLGTWEGKQLRKTVKCFVKATTEQNRANNPNPAEKESVSHLLTDSFSAFTIDNK